MCQRLHPVPFCFPLVSGGKALHFPLRIKSIMCRLSSRKTWQNGPESSLKVLICHVKGGILQDSSSSKQTASIIQEVPHKEDGVLMIWILCNMLLGCGGSHLNEFAVYHYSQEKANQSLPLHSDGCLGRGGKESNIKKKRFERKLVSPLALYTATALCQGFFQRDTCFNKKTAPY